MRVVQVIREGATRTGNATLAPHLNEALKQEVVYYTTLGIGLAARQTEISRAAQRRAGTEAVPLWEECGEVVRIDIPRVRCVLRLGWRGCAGIGAVPWRPSL